MIRTKFSKKLNSGHHILIAVDLIPMMKRLEKEPLPITGFSRSRMEYIVYLIISHRQKGYHTYAVLNMQLMKNIVPHADQYMNYLKSEGIIEWVNHSSGRNSRLYRLCNLSRTEFRTITDNYLIRRIQLNRRNIQARNSKKYPMLNRSIRLVEIDTKAALRTLEEAYNEDLANKDISTEEAQNSRTYAQAAVRRIMAKEFYYSVNTTNYRLDSNVTNLPSELIQHLTINGHKLIEMDISNSQPFLAATLFNPTPEIKAVIKRYLGQRLIINIESLQLFDCKDVKRYRSLVTSGKFYEYMVEKFDENNIPHQGRKDVKTQMFVVFFGKSNAYRYNDGAKVFRKEFPNVQRVFDMIKQKQSNRLAILLQRIESSIMLDEVAREINKQIPQLHILTKHDSILPMQLFVDGECRQARQIMVDVIEKITGLTPQGRMKKY